MKPVVFHRCAEDELDEAVAFYEARRAGLGARFQNDVKMAIDSIRKAPRRWPIYKNTDCRQYSLKRFPYTIYYMDLADHLWIVAVAHQRRNPGYWSRRLSNG